MAVTSAEVEMGGDDDIEGIPASKRWWVIVGAAAIVSLTTRHDFGRHFKNQAASARSRVLGAESSNVKQRNTTLYVLIGNIRGGEKTWKSLYKNALDVNSADLALMIGFKPNWDYSSLYQRAKYIWEVPEYEDWGDALDLIGGDGSWRRHVNANPLLFGAVNNIGPRRDLNTSKQGGCGIMMAMKWFLKKRIETLRLTEIYERFVITRADQFYLCEEDLSTLDPGFLYFPSGEDYGGIFDRHHIVGRADLFQVLSIIDRWILQPRTINASDLNCEMALMHQLKEAKVWNRVRRIDRVMFTAAVVEDTSRWTTASYHGRHRLVRPKGILTKYHDEYTASQMTCRNDVTMGLNSSSPLRQQRPLSDAARIEADSRDGWKTIHVWVGNETSDPHSMFHPTLNNVVRSWHSQVGQDKTVALLTRGKPGYFVDLAANDAVKLSNTLTLERDFGWSGLCIEPNSYYWSGLARRQCTVIAAVVGRERNEALKFLFGHNDKGEADQVFGGIVGAEFDNKDAPGNDHVEVLHTIPLDELFHKARVPREIDYMSFDVEGAESFIGNVFPWNEYTVKLLTVERPKGDLKETLRTKANMVYLRTHGWFGDEMWCHASVEAEYRALLAAG